MNLLQAAIQHIIHEEGEDAQIPLLESTLLENLWPLACHLGNRFVESLHEANMDSTIILWAGDRKIRGTMDEMLVEAGNAVLDRKSVV